MILRPTLEMAQQGGLDLKLQYLKDTIRLPHRNMIDALDRIRTSIAPFASGNLTTVVGPPGIGKTKLGEKILEDTISLYADEMRADPSFIPVIKLDVPPCKSKSSTFPWRDFYRAILHELMVPEADLPAQFSQRPGTSSVLGTRAPGEESAIHFAQYVAGQALSRRRTKVVILDECIHFANALHSSQDWGNVLKSLANNKSITFLLLGAYGTETIVRASGQLARRTDIIHFPRYGNTPEDVKAFRSVVASVQARFPLAGAKFEHLWKDLLLGSFGITGQFIRILMTALRLLEQMNKGKDINSCKWSDDIVYAAMPSPEEFESISDETVKGEFCITPFLRRPAKDAMTSLRAKHKEAILFQTKLRKAASSSTRAKRSNKAKAANA
ncbi:hypothetical protein PAQ31011_00688 [Pandoraea aquatica]|uniref:ORC1/DEAH AAA+ ATPase domain-containing protein n=2 Tax=Pandoraea aquatica TaxID=2508290 RepID=A0A5E4S9R7_9BURK|nr:hypothetical protein PAQ31011_00688 [Pandoraea aquatica]